MDANGVTRTQIFVHVIDSSVYKYFGSANLPHRQLSFKKIRTTTTAFLVSSKVVPNPYSHSTAFVPQSFTPLS